MATVVDYMCACVFACVQRVLKQGYLTKAPDLERGGGALKRWRRRWFVLNDDGEAIYYENDKVCGLATWGGGYRVSRTSHWCGGWGGARWAGFCPS